MDEPLSASTASRQALLGNRRNLKPHVDLSTRTRRRHCQLCGVQEEDMPVASSCEEAPALTDLVSSILAEGEASATAGTFNVKENVKLWMVLHQLGK